MRLSWYATVSRHVRFPTRCQRPQSHSRASNGDAVRAVGKFVRGRDRSHGARRLCQRKIPPRAGSGVSHYTTSGFLRIKLGEALEKRGVAPHIFESAEEAQSDWHNVEALSARNAGLSGGHPASIRKRKLHDAAKHLHLAHDPKCVPVLRNDHAQLKCDHRQNIALQCSFDGVSLCQRF